LGIDTVHGDPEMFFDYTFTRLPFDVSIGAFRALNPGSGYRINGVNPVFIEQNVGLSSTLSYTIPRAFDSFQVFLSYNASYFDPTLPVGPNLDPQNAITLKPQGEGLLAQVRGGFGYSSVERCLYSVGASRGFDFNLNVDVANVATGSQYDQYTVSYSS